MKLNVCIRAGCSEPTALRQCPRHRTADAICGRFLAGDTLAMLCSEYGGADVGAALREEMTRLRRRERKWKK